MPKRLATSLLGFLVLSALDTARAQERVVVAQRADSIDVEVSSSFEDTEPANGFVYRYALESRPSSHQKVSRFAVRVAETGTLAGDPPDPYSWHFLFPFGTYGMEGTGRVAFWGGLGEEGRIHPGETLDGFVLRTDLFPGITTYWAQGWTPLRVYPSENALPDTTLNHTLYDNSVSGPAVGPLYPASDVATVAATLGTIADLLDAACAVGWATDCGACNRMANELSLALREVTDGKTSAAAGRMDRFRTRLDGEKGRGLNSETHRLLTFYLRRLTTLGLN